MQYYESTFVLITHLGLYGIYMRIYIDIYIYI